MLKPTWLAIGLFTALPALFGLAIGPMVDRVERPGSWTARGWKRWALPIGLIALFPPTLFVLVVATTALALWLVIREFDSVQRLGSTTGCGLVARALWLVVATTGLVALVNDVTAIT